MIVIVFIGYLGYCTQGCRKVIIRSNQVVGSSCRRGLFPKVPDFVSWRTMATSKFCLCCFYDREGSSAQGGATDWKSVTGAITFR
jgi:hypothetical protein